MRRLHYFTAVCLAAGFVCNCFSNAYAVPLNVITVDVTPFVAPGFSQTTMGQALQMVDQGGDFNVTEVTPAAFSLMTAGALSGFDLIAVNNHPGRIAGGIGTTWQSVVGINAGGRVMLNSHDAPRFHKNFTGPYFSGPGPGPGLAPFGAPDLVRQAALWTGGAPGLTGLLIFNDASTFQGVGGVGWDNPEIALPAAWGISDHDAFGGVSLIDGGYTTTIASPADPVYAGTFVGGSPLSDVRFGVNSISSFAANIGDASFHTNFASFNPLILTPSELLINAGIVDVGGVFPSGALVAPVVVSAAGVVSNGTAITLVRQAVPEPSSIMLAGFGFVVLIAFGRRRHGKVDRSII